MVQRHDATAVQADRAALVRGSTNDEPDTEATFKVSAPDGVHLGPVHLTKTQAIVAGIIFIAAFGLLLGLTVPPPSRDPHPWDKISSVIGWWYFMAWAVSFLPQLYLNWVRKSVVGQSFDYVALNVLGFLCYSIYNVSFYCVGSVKQEYQKRFHSDNNVEINDVAFAVYSLVCCLWNTWQIVVYDRGNQRVNRLTIAFIAVCVSIFAVWGIAVAAGLRTTYFFDPLDLLYGLSVVKLAVTLIKYLPQIYLNFKRKLTVGWNIWNVLLDFTGGSLSVAQELIDAGSTGDWSGIAGNLIKFCLGSMSMVYDTVFMVQHYCLYATNNKKLIDDERAEAERLEYDVVASEEDNS